MRQYYGTLQYSESFSIIQHHCFLSVHYFLLKCCASGSTQRVKKGDILYKQKVKTMDMYMLTLEITGAITSRYIWQVRKIKWGLGIRCREWNTKLKGCREGKLQSIQEGSNRGERGKPIWGYNRIWGWG